MFFVISFDKIEINDKMKIIIKNNKNTLKNKKKLRYVHFIKRNGT